MVPMSVANAATVMSAQALRQFCLDNEIEVVLPGLDAMALTLSRHKALFDEAGISIPIPDYDVIRRGVDKSRLMGCVNSAGLPCARTVHLRSESDIQKITSLAYPVIAKAAIGHGARSVQIYEHPPADWSSLKNALKIGEMLVQEYIPGHAGSIHGCCFLFDRNHEIRLMFQQKSLKTEFDFGGAALAGVSVRDPELLLCAEKLIREIGPWVGIVMLEFKRHAQTGEFYAMDCNARLWGLSAMAQDSGLSFPYAAVLVAKNKNFRRHDDYLTGIHTERHGLSDRSTYTFSCGKSVDRLPLTSYRTNERRTIALIKEDNAENWIATTLADPRIFAVIVVKRDAGPINFGQQHNKVYLWVPPPHLVEGDLTYWMAHLFRATDVQVMDGESLSTVSRNDLQNARWSA